MNTQVLPVNDKSIALAAELLQKGELVALPTETVYGIAPTPAMEKQSKRFLRPRAAPRITP